MLSLEEHTDIKKNQKKDDEILGQNRRIGDKSWAVKEKLRVL